MSAPVLLHPTCATQVTISNSHCVPVQLWRISWRQRTSHPVWPQSKVSPTAPWRKAKRINSWICGYRSIWYELWGIFRWFGPDKVCDEQSHDPCLILCTVVWMPSRLFIRVHSLLSSDKLSQQDRGDLGCRICNKYCFALLPLLHRYKHDCCRSNRSEEI